MTSHDLSEGRPDRPLSTSGPADGALREAEERYRALFNSPDFVYLHDLEGRFLDANPAALELLGYQRDDIPSLTLASLMDDDQLAVARSLVTELLETGALNTVTEFRLWRKTGECVFVETKPALISREGKPYAVLGIGRDVTEAREAELALRASEQALKSYFDNAADAVYVLELDGRRIRDCNARACLELGYSKEELLELSGTDLESRLTPAEIDAIHHDLTPGGAKAVEGLHRRKDGSVFPVDIRLSSLAPARPDLAVAVVRDSTERKSMEESLRSAKEYAENLIRTANVMVVGLDLEGHVTVFNEEAERVTGYTRAELEGKNWFEVLVPKDRFPQVWEEFSHVLGGGTIVRAFENPILTKSRERRVISWQNSELRVNGNAAGTISFGIDITERQRAEKELREREEQLRQAQKMEAVGQLAGGIAHDFNNLLAAILGYCDLALARPELADSSAREDLEEIKHAGERASALTRQILAFSRRQALAPTVVSLGEIVHGMAPMLARTLGEDVQLMTRVDPDASWVEADAHQLEQVIMNLAVNARDAMPSGGRLTLQVADVELSEHFCRSHPGATPGAHVRLVVTDTGMGMDKVTLGRVFEPFFTTKPRGKGTGLGLATVYGTVKQSNGTVFMESRPGKGTKAKIYLPRVAPPIEEEKPSATVSTASIGSGTILLVEDEVSVRRFVARVLEGLGYSVLTAGTSAEALQLAEKGDGPIDLLLTDVVLPGGMNGDKLAHELTASHPGLPVLFVSGYPQDAIVHAGRLDEGVNFLEKPFTSQALAAAVRSLLERGDPGQEVPK